MRKVDLKKLPERGWKIESVYDSIYVIPSGKKHDSGYALMMIIGVIDGEPKEIAAYCDDICWKIPESMQYDLRNDMLYPSGILQFWSRRFGLGVGRSLSSTDITLIKK